MFSKFCYCDGIRGGLLNSTIEVAIYQFALFELNFNKAIFLSFIQIFICYFLFLSVFIK